MWEKSTFMMRQKVKSIKGFTPKKEAKTTCVLTARHHTGQ